MLILPSFLATLASIFRSRAVLGLEILALRHQIGVLKRSAVKRPKLTIGDRLLWICLSRLWRNWRSTLAIARFVPPWIASGSHLDEPFNLSFPVLCIEIEMQSAPFA